jgi:hypothetical protein
MLSAKLVAIEAAVAQPGPESSLGTRRIVPHFASVLPKRHARSAYLGGPSPGAARHPLPASGERGSRFVYAS